METARTYFADEGEASGRMYDPVMSSFLSVDRYVQNPSNSQSFNRYSYCLNNPLKYVDPSGWQMSDPYTPYAPVWGLGCHVGLEPRDFRDGSAFMTSWTLFGGGDGSLGAGGGGGGSSTVPYGFAVNNPQYTVEQQCSLIRNWQKNPSWINKWMMQKAGLSDINRGEVYVNGIRSTYLSWEYNGMSHTASIENEYVGGRGLWCQTVSDMGGRGRYVPPGYVYSSFDNAGSGLSGLQNASLLAQSFGLGNGAKTELMDWAVRTNYKSARSWGEFRNLRATQKEFRYVNTLGKTGTRYLNVCKGLGAAAAVTSMALTDANAISYYVNGGKGAGVAIKAVMDTAIGIVGFLGPVGFAISSVYFITDLATDGFGGWGNVNP